MALLERSGGQIWYEYCLPDGVSSSHVVTLINGHTRSSSDFKILSKKLRENGYATLVLDNRGSGKTETTSSFSLSDMVEDVVSIWNHCKIEKSSVLGISMGGIIAQFLSLDYSKRVDRLILVSTTHDDSWIKPTKGSWTLKDGEVEAKLASYFADGFVSKNPLLFKAMCQQIRASLTSGSFEHRAAAQRAALRASVRTIDPNLIAHKTLIVHGEKDQIIPVEAAIELSQKINPSEIEVMPEVGHLILAENAQALYRRVIEFIEG
jgi:pimeloyl-ACP methyl ester carboxylesterase